VNAPVPPPPANPPVAAKIANDNQW
jgi:hypothetical protein